MKSYKILVAGELLDSDNKIEITNPSTLKPAGSVPSIEPRELVNKAMESAHDAFVSWSATDLQQRKQLLIKFAELLITHKDELADILVAEISKAKKESVTEIERTAEYIYETIGTYENIMMHPLTIGEETHGIKGKVGKFIYEPVGVVLAISPFNYPVNLLLSKLAPALIAGNTVVYKPATQGSLIGARISELFAEAGFPSGVVNCVVGNGREVGDLLVTNPYVAMISFTGSAGVGNHIASLVSKIPLVLEMGGKDPAIVLADADLELAANEIVKGSLSYNGQRCTAIKRVLVVPEVHKQLADLIAEKAKKLTVGLPQDNTNITPVISARSADYIMSLVDDAVDKHNAKSLIPYTRKDNLISPIILDNVKLDAKVAWEEPFGPVLPIIECKNIEECIKVANTSEYGLQASIFTKDINLAESIAYKLDCGSVNINRAPSRGPDIFPFTGRKNSGFGVQGIVDAILSMVKIKGIVYNN